MVDPNTQFSNIENIMRALEEEKQQRAENQQRATQRQAQIAVGATTIARFEDCLFEFQI